MLTNFRSQKLFKGIFPTITAKFINVKKSMYTDDLWNESAASAALW